MDNAPAPLSPFEQIKHSDDAGEYWPARELANLLEYTEWRNFEKVVKKAMKACENSGHQVVDHFVDINKMVALGSGSQRKVRDYHLSRYACYLDGSSRSRRVVQSGSAYQ